MNKEKNINYCKFDNCNHKIKLTSFACKCGNIFCNFHRLPEQHNCVYDYKENNNKQVKINNMKCISQKIKKI